MAPKRDPQRSSEYSSLEEYRKAFFPESPEGLILDAADAASFGAKLAREVLRKALEASEQRPVEKEKGETKDAG